MPADELKGLSLIIPAQRNIENYYAWIYAELRKSLGARVLEIGPGSGNMAQLLVADGKAYAGVDIDKGVIDFLKGKFSEHRNCWFECGSITDDDCEESIRNFRADTVLSMNVLEHLDNREDFLRRLAFLAPGSTLILFVPAGKWLYGSIDKEAGHRLRFSKDDIFELFKAADISVEKVFYFNVTGAIGWFICNRLLRLKVNSASSGVLARFYDTAIIPVIWHTDRFFRFLFGQSLIAIGHIAPLEKKPDRPV